MKVAIIGSAYPLRGGLAAFNEHLARGFIKAGDEVSLYTFSLQYPSFLFPGKTQYSEDPAPDGLNIKVCINSINPFNWFKVAKMIRSSQPDLVICPFWLPFMGPCLGTIMKLISKNKQLKRISVMHNIIPHEQRWGDTFLARYFVKQAQAFVVMSAAVGKDLQQFVDEQPISLIPHPIYDHYGPLSTKNKSSVLLELDPEQHYVMFFGFIRKYKGLDILLKAMADVRIQSLKIKLIVAGEYYEEAQFYLDLIDELGIAEQVILKTEYIANEEVRHYFAMADLLVQPYRTATQSGISQMAYHFEKPMLVTKVGGLPEIVSHGNSGYVVEPNNHVVVADAIVDFYTNNRKVELESGVKADKEKFSWDNMVQGIKELI